MPEDNPAAAVSGVRAPSPVVQVVREWTNLASLETQPGLTIRPVVGEKLLANFVQFAPETAAPAHTHDEEQLIVMLEGELEVTVGTEVHALHVGDAVLIPSHVPHSARTGAGPAIELDVFSPPRQGVLDLIADAGLQVGPNLG